MEIANTTKDQSVSLEGVKRCSSYTNKTTRKMCAMYEDSCPHCETNYENDWHVVIGCKEAKKAWTEDRLWDLISDVGSVMNFVECIFSLLCRFPCNASHGQLKDRICSTNRYSNINTYRM